MIGFFEPEDEGRTNLVRSIHMATIVPTYIYAVVRREWSTRIPSARQTEGNIYDTPILFINGVLSHTKSSIFERFNNLTI